VLTVPRDGTHSSDRAIQASRETQALGKVLAVTRAVNGGPGEEVAYRRPGMNRQPLRHQLLGAFGVAQLRAASRRHGTRGGVCWSAPGEIYQGLHEAA
jgi:hypothetical protein